MRFRVPALCHNALPVHCLDRFDRSKGGAAWKLAVSQYVIGKVPAMIEIFKWARSHDQPTVTDEAFDAVVGTFIGERQQVELQSQLCSFLARCLSGGAQTMFNQAAQLNGLDAWRRAVRQIDSGMGLRLEELTREMRVIHLKLQLCKIDFQRFICTID